MQIIMLAGLTSGGLDIISALTLNKLKGVTAMRSLQVISSGVLGPKAFAGGGVTAAMGLGIHFFIAVVVAATYYVASRKLGVLVEYAALCGMLYGIGVHLFMTFIVLPLSGVRRPFSFTAFAAQLIIHMFCVGLAISLVIRHFN